MTFDEQSARLVGIPVRPLSIGFNVLVGMMQFGTLPADLTHRSMTMFAEKVMPHLRAQQLEGAAA